MILQLPSHRCNCALLLLTHSHALLQIHTCVTHPLQGALSLLSLSLSKSLPLFCRGLCPCAAFYVALHSKEEMRLPIEVIMDFDSPSCANNDSDDAAAAVDAAAVGAAVAVSYSFLYDYVRCSFCAY